MKDKVSYNGKMLKVEAKKVYYMLNKPKGYISSVKDEKGRKTVVDILSDVEERIFRTSLLPDVSRHYRGRLVCPFIGRKTENKSSTECT